MRFDLDAYIEVAFGAVGDGFTVFPQTDSGAVVDAGRNL
jgi:hypothetical protein